MKGGSNIPASKRLKFMFLKKGCLLTSAAPSAWQPSLCFASLVSSCEKTESHVAMPRGPSSSWRQRGCGRPVVTSVSQVHPSASPVSLVQASPACATQWTWPGPAQGLFHGHVRGHIQSLLRCLQPPGQQECPVPVSTGHPLMFAEWMVPLLIQGSCKGEGSTWRSLIHLLNSQVQS